MLAAILGCVMIAAVLTDGFITIVLPRRMRHIFRMARVFYRFTWKPFAALGRRISDGQAREEFLSIYGPLSLLMLLALWAAGLILGFGLLQWAAGMQSEIVHPSFANDLFVSATTLFTVSSGDPRNSVSKILTVVESGCGLSFLGLVIGYLPVLYQSFSNREQRITLLDARAGSPPSSGDLLISLPHAAGELEHQLMDWEEWFAQCWRTSYHSPCFPTFARTMPTSLG
jgi:hypothetical protein